MTLRPSTFVQLHSKQDVLHHFQQILHLALPQLPPHPLSLKQAESFVHELNAFPEELEIPSLTQSKELRTWRSSPEYSRFYQQSLFQILHGKVIFWLLWAGEASRVASALSESDAFFYNLEGQKTSTLPSKPFFHGAGHGCPRELNLAVRQMLQRRLDLERLIHSLGESHRLHYWLSQIPFIVHVNEENCEGILHLFRHYRFFGFNPQKILFILQDGLPGAFWDGHQWIPYERRRPAGHGYPLLQLGWKGQGFFPSPCPSPAAPLPALSPLEYFQDAELLCAFPIEDNTLLRQAFDLDRLAIANALFAENPQRMLVLEAMLNLKGQKGGAFLKSKTHPAGMMVESLQLQTPLHQKLFQNPKEQPLLNRNITYLKVQHFRKTIPQEGLYFTFSAKDPDLRGLPGIWPDLVTCILTQSPQFLGSGVFYEEGLAIENFKTATDIPLLVQRFKEQEEQEGFHALWHQYRHALEI